MFKNKFLGIIVFLSLTSVYGLDFFDELNNNRKNLEVSPFETDNGSTEVVLNYSDGTKLSCYLKDGKINGTCKHLNKVYISPNGYYIAKGPDVIQETNFKDNLRNGISKTWYPDFLELQNYSTNKNDYEFIDKYKSKSVVKEIHTYNENIIQGTSKYYYNNGTIETTIDHNQNGEIDGFYKDFYRGNLIKKKMSTKISKLANIKFEELKTIYHMQDAYVDGPLQREIKYKNGKRISYKTYFLSGRLECNYKIINGQINGETKCYSDEKKPYITRILNYVDGKLDGKSKNFDETGKLISVKNYKNGEEI